MSNNGFCYVIDLDTRGVVLSGLRGDVDAKVKMMAAAVNNETVQRLVASMGLPAVSCHYGILEGPFTQEEMDNICEYRDFAYQLFCQRNAIEPLTNGPSYP